MKNTTIRRAYVAAVLSVATASAYAVDAQMLCEPTGESNCSDPCVYFPKDVTFHAVADGALLIYEGVVYKLRLKSERVVRRMDPIAELPGHTTVANYSDKELRVELKSTVASTSCFYRNARGVYEESGSCCAGESHMQLRVSKRGKTQVLSTKWEWGC